MAVTALCPTASLDPIPSVYPHALSGPLRLWAPATARWSEEASGDTARADTGSESAETWSEGPSWALLGGCLRPLHTWASCFLDSDPWREVLIAGQKACEGCAPGAQGAVSKVGKLYTTVTWTP